MKSTLKRLIEQNPEGIADRILELERMCSDHESEVEGLKKASYDIRKCFEVVIAEKDAELCEAQAQIAMLLRAEQCPNCDNVGWYQVGHEENEQCEFCYTNPKSIYNVHRDLQATALAYENGVKSKARVEALAEAIGFAGDYSDRHGNIYSSDFLSLLRGLIEQERAN